MNIVKQINERLDIGEKKITWENILSRPDLFYGLVNCNSSVVDFEKFSRTSIIELRKYGLKVNQELERFHDCCSGVSIIFRTNAPKIYLQCRLKRKYSNAKLTLFGSSGFDVYDWDGKKWIHRTVFSPGEGEDTFFESINNYGHAIRIFLPNYNSIKELLFGLEDGYNIEPAQILSKKPIIIYGNSVTQGASASRCGNSFSNIVSRMLNRNTINISCSSCCKGNMGMADEIGSYNSAGIVIDYQRNAFDIKQFQETYEDFIFRIREWNKCAPIILLKTMNFSKRKAYYEYDQVIENVFNKARINGDDKIHIIDTMSLFYDEDYQFYAIDECHCNDIVFYILADEVCKLFELYLNDEL